MRKGGTKGFVTTVSKALALKTVTMQGGGGRKLSRVA